MKQKTVKTAAKRVIKTGRGKLRRRKLSAQHLVAGKSKRTLKKSRKLENFSSADIKKIKRMIPNR